MREERFIIKVMEMHYRQGLSQVEIGKKLNVSRTTVSRALVQARREGYVQIKFNYPKDNMTSLESLLEEKYGLKEAVIAGVKEDCDAAEEVAFFASDYILRVLKNHMTLALTWGITMKKTVDCLARDVRLRFLKTSDVKVVPLMAASNIPATAAKEYRLVYSNYLIEEVGRIIGGNSYQMLAPRYVASKEARDSFLKEESIREVMDMAKHADVAVIGIGTVDEHSALVTADLISKEEFERLRTKGATGEVLSHIINKEGEIVEEAFEERLISLGLEDLKKIPIRVGVACGMAKNEAILSALKGHLINVLVTDEQVANYLMKEA